MKLNHGSFMKLSHDLMAGSRDELSFLTFILDPRLQDCNLRFLRSLWSELKHEHLEASPLLKTLELAGATDPPCLSWWRPFQLGPPNWHFWPKYGRHDPQQSLLPRNAVLSHALRLKLKSRDRLPNQMHLGCFGGKQTVRASWLCLSCFTTFRSKRQETTWIRYLP